MKIVGFKHQQIEKIIAVLFILLFVYAATGKLLRYEQFSIQLGQVSFLKPLAPVLSWAIPLLEYILTALLLKAETRRLGMMGSAILMSVFTLYIAGMITFSPQLPCSCGGIINKLTWQQHLVFNLFFTALAYFGWYRYYCLKTQKS